MLWCALIYFDELYREMYHYIYMIKFNTGQFYIGSRTSKLPPEKDTKYWGSPVTYKHLWENSSLEKTKHIIKVCEDVEEKRKIEPKLIKAAWEKYGDLCLNRNAAPSFHPDICRQVGLNHYKNKTGIFSISKEKRIELGKRNGKIAAQKNRKNKTGIFGMSIEERKEAGKKGAETTYKLGKGIHAITSEERKKIGRKSGLNHYKNGTAIFSLTKEQQIELGKRVGKYVQENHSLEFKLKSPTGEIIQEKNVRKFCRDHQLSRYQILEVLRGNKKSYNGWSLPGTNINDIVPIKDRNSGREYQLKSPDGKIHIGKNISKLCRDYNLSPSCINNVIAGISEHHRGWTLSTKEKIDFFVPQERWAKQFNLRNPHGEIVFCKNLRKFCRENNLDRSSINKVLKGKVKHHKGWTLP